MNEKIKEYETKLTEQSKSERKIKEELSSKINELEQKLQNQSNQFDIKNNELLQNFEDVQSEKNGLENKSSCFPKFPILFLDSGPWWKCAHLIFFQ